MTRYTLWVRRICCGAQSDDGWPVQSYDVLFAIAITLTAIGTAGCFVSAVMLVAS